MKEFTLMPSSLRKATLSTVAALAAAVPSVHTAAARGPNVVVIVADDLGNADPGFQGGREIATPHLDALARAGVRCTNGYVSGPYCSPTRAGLLTGRYQQRFGHEFNPGPPAEAADTVGLPLSERTIADTFKSAGYRTGLVGKWHLGHADRFHPLDRGFEEFFGFLGGAHAYHPQGGVERGPNAILRGREPVEEKDYLTAAFAREAEAFIERHRSEPFLLLLTFNAVHGPLQATAADESRFATIADPKRRTYAAMLAALDDAVGRVTAALERAAILDDTLIVFFSDNGGPPVNASSNGSLRGYKASTWEGGIRVPFFVTWKNGLKGGATFDHPVIQIDVYPTALAAAGIDRPSGAAIDGVNLLPHLAGTEAAAPHDRLFWRFGQQTAIREGDWKLVHATGSDAPLLVNLADDPGESRDLSAAHPDNRRALEEAWQRWNADLAAPLWKANRAKAAPNKEKKRRAAASSAAATAPQ